MNDELIIEFNMINVLICIDERESEREKEGEMHNDAMKISAETNTNPNNDTI